MEENSVLGLSVPLLLTEGDLYGTKITGCDFIF